MLKTGLKRKLRPCMDMILVRLKDVGKDQEVKTDWGFVTEIKSSDKLTQEQYATQEAHVVWVGPWAYGDQPPECKEGDLVLIAKYSGEDRKDLTGDGSIHRLILDRDVFGVFEGEELCQQ